MHHIIIQYATDKKSVPSNLKLRSWAKAALNHEMSSAEVTLRIVSPKEMTNLNTTYRHKEGSTNILSFPFSVPPGVDLKVPILGDVVICAEVVNREAIEQHKTPDAHWAHMVVHGILHLMGYDHESDSQADEMEGIEIKILQSLSFPNPYETGDDIHQYD